MGRRRVSLENFRAKQAAELKLGSRLTLLMSENGSGKTTCLDAIPLHWVQFLLICQTRAEIASEKGEIFSNAMDGKLLTHELRLNP